MRAPSFWQRGRGRLAGPLLAPASAIWRAATRRRLRRGARVRLDIPVICVGNLTVGGTGKTPTVIALVERLGAMGLAPAMVSRGYGGRLAGPVAVDPARHTARDVGDEPLLLAQWGPVFVGRDREAAAREAADHGARAIVLDDGHQNASLAKDLSILVVDAGQGFGNGRVLPAGPLRETVAEGLARADIVLAVGDADALLAEWPDLATRPVVRGRIEPLATGMPWAGLPVVAFAGIGRPEKFFASLETLGARILRRHAFGDHEPYGRAILERLAAEAARLGAQLVTTEKDLVRLPSAWRGRVLALPVRMVLADNAPLDAALARLAGTAPPA